MTDTTDTATKESEALHAIAEATDGDLGYYAVNCIVVFDRHQIVFGFAEGTLGWSINTLTSGIFGHGDYGAWENFENVETALTPANSSLEAIGARCELAVHENSAHPEDRAREYAQEYVVWVKDDPTA